MNELPEILAFPNPRLVQSTCVWCRRLNVLEAHWCWQCGHRAHWPKQHCDCEPCTLLRLLAAADPYKDAR
jgi:hypothetical protein